MSRNEQDASTVKFQMTLDDLEALDQNFRISLLTAAGLLFFSGCFILLNA